MRMPGCLGFGLGWNLLAGRELKPRLRHGCMALAILKNDAPVQHFVSLQCKDSGVPLLGPILGVNFGSSGAQKRGPFYESRFHRTAFLGTQKWTPFQVERG